MHYQSNLGGTSLECRYVFGRDFWEPMGRCQVFFDWMGTWVNSCLIGWWWDLMVSLGRMGHLDGI